ncbi:MAG: hypothetical protein AAB288_09665 [Acidobacteriota bacterium]
MSSQPQLSFLVGQAVNHVIGQMAINFTQGQAWEIERVDRIDLTSASVVFAVGKIYDDVPDDRPRVTVAIDARPYEQPRDGETESTTGESA